MPWIGVIALGYAIGPWFAEEAARRRRRLVRWGAGLLLGFVALRAVNLYGDAPWFVVPGSPLRTAMSMMALTKYPPSLLYLLPTLGIGAWLLAGFERWDGPIARRLTVLGGAPMGFYLLHLYVLRLLYLGRAGDLGAQSGQGLWLPRARLGLAAGGHPHRPALSADPLVRGVEAASAGPHLA